MTINERENNLFARWADHRPGLVRDGVVSESAYLGSPSKIVFVLKDVNDQSGGGWDLREFIAAGARSPTWDNITRWLKGIRNLNQDLSWGQLSQIGAKDRVEMLQSICAVNLKKSPGGHTNNAQQLADIAAQDRNLLKEQFSLYDPDLIICCGTGGELDNVLGEGEWRTTSRGVSFREIGPKKFAIGYAHPEARVGSPLLYYGLIDAVREITRQTAILHIHRRISSNKWQRMRATMCDLLPERRWKFILQKESIVCGRTWLKDAVYELEFQEVIQDDLHLYTEFPSALVHLQHLEDRSEESMREEINLLIDELVSPDEYA